MVCTKRSCARRRHPRARPRLSVGSGRPEEGHRRLYRTALRQDRHPVSADETPAEETPAGWTLGQVCVGYQGFLAHDRWINDRTKPPSEATNDDVRRAFGQASYQYLGIAPVLQLDRVQLNAARDGSRLTVSARKCTEYVKAAISWAAAEHPDESGLTEKMSPWWENVNAGKPDPTAMQEIEQRRKTHRQAKANLDVDAVAATLIAHEKYCSLTRNTAQRTSAYRASRSYCRDQVGLWWVAFTGKRRLSTVELLRDNLKEQDGIRRARFGPRRVDGRADDGERGFLAAAAAGRLRRRRGAMADWQKAINYNHGAGTAGTKTEWVFATQQRAKPGGIGLEIKDLRVYPKV